MISCSIASGTNYIQRQSASLFLQNYCRRGTIAIVALRRIHQYSSLFLLDHPLQSQSSTKRYKNTKCTSFAKRQLFNIALIGTPGSGKGTYGSLLCEQQKSSLPSSSPSSLHYTPLIMGDILRNHVKNQTLIGMEVQECQSQGKLADDALVSRALLLHLTEKNHNVDDESSTATTSTTTVNHEGKENQLVGFLFDGFPRTVRQADIMSTSWPERFQLSLAISIDVPDEICIHKILGRRQCTICGGSFNVAHVDTKDGFYMPPTLPDTSIDPCLQEEGCDYVENDGHDYDGSNWVKRQDDVKEVIVKRMEEYHRETKPLLEYYNNLGKLARFVPYRGREDIPILEKIILDKAKEFNAM